MAKSHCAADQVLYVLKNTKQLYFHPKVSSNGGTRRNPSSSDLILDDSKIKVGCCSMFYFCGG